MNVVNVVPMRPSTMSPPTRNDEPHVPVLEQEVLDALKPRAGGCYLDVTLGAGGHAAAILRASRAAQVIGLDRDPAALALAQRRLASFGARVLLRRARFTELTAILESVGVERVDGIVADLGLSSMQLDDEARGMSFRRAGPLDMRMDPAAGETAWSLIERLSDQELADVLYRLGDERRSRRIARCIKQAAAAGRLTTTLDLRRAVVKAVGPWRVGGVDPATRTFQALRVAVNEELEELQALLAAAGDHLTAGGVLAVISFHSLEDRMVKRAFQDRDRWRPLTKKPVQPAQAELDDNPRSHSAKLRAAARLGVAEGT